MYKKHGQKGTPTYTSWRMMRARCSDPKHDAYRYYGGKGIVVCERWESFALFYEDMGDRPDGCTLDRIDSTKDYCKENCRWATKLEQMNNTSFNRKLTVNGRTQNLAEWARETGVNQGTIWNRWKKGETGADLIRPPDRLRRKRAPQT